MRLPALIIAQPLDAARALPLPATHVDPTEVSDAGQTPAGRKPWWVRASGAIMEGAFTNVTAALIVVTGAVYVGMVHAPWVTRLASRTSVAAQAGNAVSVAMAAAPAVAAALAQPEASTTQPASSERVAAARDRMEQRIYSQAPPRARSVSENDTLNDSTPTLDSDGPASGRARRQHRGTRHARRGAGWNGAWYKGT